MGGVDVAGYVYCVSGFKISFDSGASMALSEREC